MKLHWDYLAVQFSWYGLDISRYYSVFGFDRLMVSLLTKERFIFNNMEFLEIKYNHLATDPLFVASEI